MEPQKWYGQLRLWMDMLLVETSWKCLFGGHCDVDYIDVVVRKVD